VLQKMFVPVGGAGIERVGAFLPMLLVAAGWAMIGKNTAELREREWRFRDAMALAAAGGACIAVMLSDAGSPFLYFQF
jgi:hypothetical protein